MAADWLLSSYSQGAFDDVFVRRNVSAQARVRDYFAAAKSLLLDDAQRAQVPTVLDQLLTKGLRMDGMPAGGQAIAGEILDYLMARDSPLATRSESLRGLPFDMVSEIAALADERDIPMLDILMDGRPVFGAPDRGTGDQTPIHFLLHPQEVKQLLVELERVSEQSDELRDLITEGVTERELMQPLRRVASENRGLYGTLDS